jgi:hypothetical protein
VHAVSEVAPYQQPHYLIIRLPGYRLLELTTGLLYCLVNGHVTYEQAGKTTWQHVLANSVAICMAVSFKMMSKWSSEDVVKFLDVYEDFEGIWNIRHSDCNNKIKRDN